MLSNRPMLLFSDEIQDSDSWENIIILLLLIKIVQTIAEIVFIII